MAKPRSKSGLMLILAAPVMAGGLLALATVLQPWQERLLLEHWQERIDGLADEEISAVCDQLAQAGEMGTRVLVGQLDSERDLVCRRVHAALRDAIDAWQEDALCDAPAKLALVAETLAESVDGYGPEARERAADIAHRILLWRTDGDGFDRPVLVAECERVLRLAAAYPHPVATNDVRPAADLPYGAESTPSATLLPVSGGETLDGQPSPVDLASSDDGPEPPRPDPLPLSLAVCPGGGPLPASATPQAAPPPSCGNRIEEHRRSHKRAPRVLAAPPYPHPIPRPASAPSRLQATTAAVPHTPVAAPGALEGLATVDVMRRLHDRAPDVVATAEQELLERGLNTGQVALARQLTDPDPAVRRRLVDLLPEIPAVDARPWLLWLSADHHADVRLAALTVMATSKDPDLLRRVEKIVSHDRDPRITALGKRLLEQQRR